MWHPLMNSDNDPGSPSSSPPLFRPDEFLEHLDDARCRPSTGSSSIVPSFDPTADDLSFWRTPASASYKNVKPIIPKVKTAPPPVEKKDDFESALLEYGRAVIKSAMDHPPEQARMLENEILTTKKKVLMEHKNSTKNLEVSLLATKYEVERLGRTIDIRNDEKVALGQELKVELDVASDLERELGHEKGEKIKFMEMFDDSVDTNNRLKRKCQDLVREKRKRSRVEEIWEKAEKVKV